MEICPICQENLKFNKRKVIKTPCNHSFHEMCFKKIIVKTCPCCREPVQEKKESLVKILTKKLKKIKYDFNKDKSSFKNYTQSVRAMQKLVKNIEKKKRTESIKFNLIERELFLESMNKEIEALNEKINYIKIYIIQPCHVHYSNSIIKITDLLNEAIINEKYLSSINI